MIDYESIIKEYGTPTYVYDINTLLNRVEYLKSKFNSNFNMVYAIKANTFIVKEINDSVDRFEICSTGEYEICNKLNIPYNKMVISGVNKDKSFIENLINKHEDILIYTIESITHFNILKECAKKYNRKINVLIRLTSGNQFGVSEDDFKYIIENNIDLINIKGIEYFSGTQKHSLKRINREIDYLLEFAKSIENDYDIKLEEIEYGPGLPIYYFQDDEFNEDEFLTEVNNIIEKLNDYEVSLEIGRSIAASCGSYLTSVVDIKSNKNGNFVIVDGGMNHLVYYGQTMAMRIPYYEVLPTNDDEIISYNIHGSLCTVNDIIVKNINTRKLNIGDAFVFKNTGAYSSTEGISLFLSRELPKVIIVKKDGNTILVRDIIKTSEVNYPNY